MKVRRKFAVLLIFAAALLMVLSIPVSAAAKTYKSEWTHSNGNYYYWNAKGVKFKGFHKLGSKYYFLTPRAFSVPDGVIPKEIIAFLPRPTAKKDIWSKTRP